MGLECQNNSKNGLDHAHLTASCLSAWAKSERVQFCQDCLLTWCKNHAACFHGMIAIGTAGMTDPVAEHSAPSQSTNHSIKYFRVASFQHKHLGMRRSQCQIIVGTSSPPQAKHVHVGLGESVLVLFHVSEGSQDSRKSCIETFSASFLDIRSMFMSSLECVLLVSTVS